MSKAAKALSVFLIVIVCGIGFVSGIRLYRTNENKLAGVRELPSLPALIEEKLVCRYPGFRGIKSIELGLSQTTNSSCLELEVTDMAGNCYLCLSTRTSAGWKVERVRRIKVARPQIFA